jgi:hypothetical protein
MGKVSNLRVIILIENTGTDNHRAMPGGIRSLFCKELLGIPEDEYVDLLVGEVLR